jgi:hypothetical protein
MLGNVPVTLDATAETRAATPDTVDDADVAA